MLKDRVEELKKEMDEFMDEIMKLCGIEMFENIDEETFGIMQKMIRMFRLSENLMIEQATIMDNMNEKLDKLLERSEGV